MKKILQFLVMSCVVINIEAQISPINFTVTNNTGTNLLTCFTPSINLSASSDFTGTVNYLWVSSSGSLSGSNVNIVSPGNYTIYAFGSNSATATQSLSIGQNTMAPSTAVTPTLQNITCSLSSVTTVTASSIPGLNVWHYILAPQGGTFVSIDSTTTYYTPQASGTYTFVATNNMNGCSTIETFTVTSSQSFPTFSLVSPQNFTLGCNSKSVAVINIVNASTAPPGGPISYTLLAPGGFTTTPSGTLSPLSSYSVNTPGTWTAVTKDNTSFCETRVPFSVLQNTFTPGISVIVPTQVLNCDISQVVLQGVSNTPNVSYTWSFPSTPGSVSGSTIAVSSLSAVPTITLVSNYTLTIVDNNTTCQSTSVIPVYQNLFPPNALIANGGLNAITCSIPTIALTNQSTSNIPPSTGFPTNQPVIAYLWTGPLPQAPQSNTTTYVAATPGVYTMSVKDLNNGCTSSTVITVGDNRIYPVVNNPAPPPAACLNGPSGMGTATITPVISGSTAGLTYTWTSPAGANVSGTNTAVLTTNLAGTYTVVVTNSTNGCSSTGQLSVIECVVGITKNTRLHYSLSLFPNPGKGLFTIVSESIKEGTVLEIYNMLGMLVKKQEVTTDRPVIDLQSESDGMYLLQVIENNKLVHTSKLLKQ